MDAVAMAAGAVAELAPHQRKELAEQLLASIVEVDDTVSAGELLEDVADLVEYLVAHPGEVYTVLRNER